jgi:SPP1 family predicted phage head-tail adaptor
MKCCDPEFNPANFRHRIEIQSLSLAPNDTGGQDQSWATFATVWASIKPKLTKEVNFAQRIEPRVDHEIRMRYLSGLTTTMRIVFETRIFEIKAIITPDEVKEFNMILATERTGT